MGNCGGESRRRAAVTCFALSGGQGLRPPVAVPDSASGWEGEGSVLPVWHSPRCRDVRLASNWFRLAPNEIKLGLKISFSKVY